MGIPSDIQETLDQDQIWCFGSERVPMLVDRMESRHRRNVLRWLEARSEQLHDQYFWRWYAMAPDGVFEQAMAAEYPDDETRGNSHLRWLYARPLVRRLCELEGIGVTLGGESIIKVKGELMSAPLAIEQGRDNG
jgi:hypothetical protein